MIKDFISMEFVNKMNKTEQEAQRFFEHNPSLTTPDMLIKMAVIKGYNKRDDIDFDLFKHLMKKYHFLGY